MASLVGSSHKLTTATIPEEAATTTAAARSAATVVISASSGVVAVVVAAADETRHAEARLAKPSQASQSREGLTNSSIKYEVFETVSREAAFSDASPNNVPFSVFPKEAGRAPDQNL